MRTKLSLLILMIFLGLQSSFAFAAKPDFYTAFRHLPASVHVYHYRGKAKRTMWLFTALPQLYIFDADGREVLAHKGGYDDLAGTLSRTFSKPIPIEHSKPLASWMNKLTAVRPQTYQFSSGARFTILEYWATWCHYCYEERDQLLAYFRAHPHLSVNLVTVDTDKP